MKHRKSSKFRKHYALLPTEIKSLADRCFEALRENSRHPSLHFKRIAKCWSARIGLNYRALGIPEEYGVLWFWIGPHSDYTQLLRRLRDRKIE